MNGIEFGGEVGGLGCGERTNEVCGSVAREGQADFIVGLLV